MIRILPRYIVIEADFFDIVLETLAINVLNRSDGRMQSLD
jgi:hypothetical protein